MIKWKAGSNAHFVGQIQIIHPLEYIPRNSPDSVIQGFLNRLTSYRKNLFSPTLSSLSDILNKEEKYSLQETKAMHARGQVQNEMNGITNFDVIKKTQFS